MCYSVTGSAFPVKREPSRLKHPEGIHLNGMLDIQSLRLSKALPPPVTAGTRYPEKQLAGLGI